MDRRAWSGSGRRLNQARRVTATGCWARADKMAMAVEEEKECGNKEV